MLFYVLSVIIFIISFARIDKTDKEAQETFIGLRILSIVCLMFCMFTSGMCWSTRNASIEQFDQNADIIRASMANENITENERLNTIYKIRTNNQKIRGAKRFHKNVLVGIWNADWRMDKEMFKFSDIPHVKYNILMKTEDSK